MMDVFTAARLAGLAAAYRVLRARSDAAREDLHATLAAAGVSPRPVLARLERDNVFGAGDERFAAYRAALGEERALADGATVLLERHPAWPWLSRLAGLEPGPVLALLPLLDVHAAAAPSAFHAACGLDVVDADAYRCAECGRELSGQAGDESRGAHVRADGRGPCAGAPVVRAPKRVARPLYAGGAVPDVRLEARGATSRIARALIAAGGAFARYHEWERGRIQTRHPGWPELRVCKATARRVEKLFLTHLWTVWRAAEGHRSAPTLHHAMPRRFRDPWSMASRRRTSGRRHRTRAA